MSLPIPLSRALVCAACACASAFAAATYTYPDLVARLYDMKALAVPAPAGEVSGNVSTYDRASRYDAETDRYVDWGANGDGGRTENVPQTVAELKGPGVIWRIWSARPESGHIQIFIDGAATPALDMPFEALFDNTKAPFAYSALNATMARGCNFFIPIAYQTACKIVMQPNWGRYFQATYTRFVGGTVVPSFTGTFSEEDKAALAHAQQVLSARGNLPPLTADAAESRRAGGVRRASVVVPPHGQATLATFDGAGAICEIRMETPCARAGEASARALRELAVSATFDGNDAPSVWAPLSDFFGCGYGANTFQARPCGLTRDGVFYARWYMPFKNGAAVRLANDGDTPRTVTAWVVSEALEPAAVPPLRFHAKWHRGYFGKTPERYADDRWPDWPFLMADGARGRFCGLSLHIWNPIHLWNKIHREKYEPQPPPVAPRVCESAVKNGMLNRWWWGEGDEKFFVDGEKMPSTFGTGSEDYFGYAWGNPTRFDSATQAQSRVHDNIGHICVARWHIADNVPFQKSFEGAIEKYHGDNWPLLYAATAYWYQSADVPDNYAPQPMAVRADYFAAPKLKPDWAAQHADTLDAEPANARIVQCETASLAASHGVSPTTQRMAAWDVARWGAETQLLCKSDDGGALTFSIPAEDAAPRMLVLFATRAPDYGTLAFSVNGEAIAPQFDGYAPEVASPKAFLLGTFAPKDGKFLLTVRVCGKNKASRGYYFGLDALSLRLP